MMQSELQKRISTGIFYAGLVFVATTNSNHWFFVSLIAVFYLFCYYEFQKISRMEHWYMKLLGLSAGAFVLFFFYNFITYPFSFRLFMPVILFAIAILTIQRFPHEISTDSAKLITSVSYISLPLGLSFCLPQTNDWRYGMVLYVFILIWASDTFAYFIGKYFGKRPLAISVSANKTWEGLLSGVLGSIFVGLAMQYFIEEQFNFIPLALIVGVFAPIGDLTESKLKRSFGVKDSSNLLPGHGGFLDRLDSFIFVLPIVYIYYVLI